MTLLVPFDGSDLAESALKRAREFASYRDEEVVALTVVPEDESFATERGWIKPGEPYDPGEICTASRSSSSGARTPAASRCR